MRDDMVSRPVEELHSECVCWKKARGSLADEEDAKMSYYLATIPVKHNLE